MCIRDRLYVGRVAVEKNIEAFLETRHPGTKVIVGDGPALDELCARFPDACFLGKLGGERLAGAYAGADVFVFPSRTDTFGPVSYTHLDVYKRQVVVLSRFTDWNAALAEVNDSKFGLQAGIFTRDIHKILEAWDDLDVGGIVVNDVSSYRVDNMPYGGVKDSGLGREGIRFAMEDMSEIRNLVIRRV